LVESIDRWVGDLISGEPADAFQQELGATIERFLLPLWPWEKLAEAMRFDLTHSGFATWRQFRRYCEGAAVAPASVFMHLCGLGEKSGRFLAPVFDVRRAARPLALFSYLVHVLRDFEKDQRHNLTYFSHDLLQQHDLTEQQLREIAHSGRVPLSFRRLVGQYVEFAEYYRGQARESVDRIAPFLSPRYQLSLEIIYGLYLQIFERIDPQTGRFSTDESTPPPEAVRQRIDRIVSSFEPVVGGI
ncbi:MAG: squalene/phytoene synthase family protein, partial [Candidatus Zixiibacteriota bacterium]